MAAKFDRHPEELAALHGARLVTAAETDEGRKWAEQRIKQMTGGDLIRARFMRRDSFEYRPAFKLLFLGNHAPDIENLDDAMRRRFNIVPFTRKPKAPDASLFDHLKAEWPGIFRWMIDGCLDWQQHGLVRPEAVLQATAEYFNEQDVFATWLSEKCLRDPGNDYRRAFTAELFRSWQQYARAAGEEPGSQKGFGSRMRRHGVFSNKTTIRIGEKVARGYLGIELLQPEITDHQNVTV
jgi:putative DNA primase/helicase